MKIINSPWTIIIMAISISVVILSFAIFHETIPLTTAAGYYRDYGDKLEIQANKMQQAKQRVATAIKMVQEKTDVWNAYVATRTPPTTVRAGGIDLSVNPYQLAINTLQFRNSIQRAVNAQVKRGGVTVINGPYVPGPTDLDAVSNLVADYYHYPGIVFPVVIFNLGAVTVQGTYRQIMNNVRSYASMPHFLAVADGLRIDGTSPTLTGTYNLTVVGFIRGTRLFGTVPEGAGGATNGAAGGAGLGGAGFAGGFPGRGGPGGPPPGFGGPPAGAIPGGPPGG